jgi:hypothetical protein
MARSNGGATLLLLSPDGYQALMQPWPSHTLLRWDVTSGRPLPAFSRIEPRNQCAAFAPDGATLAVGGGDGVVYLHETGKGEEVRRLADDVKAFALCNVAFSPDGQTLAATYTFGTLTLWDLNRRRLRHRLSVPHLKRSQGLAFSGDGRLLAVSWEGEHFFRLYETASGQEIRPLRARAISVGSLAFAPDNRTLAIGDARPSQPAESVSEFAIRLWDLPTHQLIRVLRGHRGDVHTLAFSPDGTSLLSGSEDNTVLSWDVADVICSRPSGEGLSTGRLADLWSDLAAADAARAQSAVAELIQAPEAALPFLERSLPPVPPAKMAGIVALIADLDHEQFARREKASQGLEKIGEPAVAALRKVLKERPSPEMRKRILAILETIDGRPLSPERFRAIRTLQVLESIATREARRVLECLAGGAEGAWLTQEAKASLQRLLRRSGKP